MSGLPTSRVGQDGITTYHWGNAISTADEASNLGPFTIDGISFPYMLWQTRYRQRVKPFQIIRTPAQIIAERLMFPFGDIGVPSNDVNVAAYAGPASTSSITRYMPTTGERPDLGLITDPSAHFMLTGSPTAMLAWAQAASSFNFHYMDRATGRPIDLIKYPHANNYDEEGKQGEPWMRRISTAPYVDNPPMVTDTPHWCEMSYMAYVATGDLGFLEDLQYAANFAVFSDAYWSGQEGRAVVSCGQTRQVAWGLRNLGMALRATMDAEAMGVLPSTCHPSSYFRTLLTQSREFIEKQFMNDPARQLTRAVSGVGGVPGISGYAFGPWQMDYLLTALAWVVLAGFSDFVPLYTWAFGNVVWRTNGASGWPVAWCGYYLPAEGFASIPDLWKSFSENTPEQITPAQAAQMNADPYNGGYTAYRSQGEYAMTTRAVLCDGLYLQDLGLADLRGTYQDIETCFTNADRMVRNHGEVNARVSVVRDPSQAPGEIIPPPDPKPPTEITMSDTKLAVGETKHITIAITPADADQTGLAYSASPDGLVSLSPDLTGVSVTRIMRDKATITATLNGLTATAEALDAIPLADAIALSWDS